MAGSKTFLQPILNETVGGIQTAVDNVVTVVDPIPEKIDDQIDALMTLGNVMSSAVQTLMVSKYDADETFIINNDAVSSIGGQCSTTNMSTIGSEVTIFTIKTYCKGSLNIECLSCAINAYNTDNYGQTGTFKAKYSIVDENGTEITSASSTEGTENTTDPTNIVELIPPVLNFEVSENTKYTLKIFLYGKTSVSMRRYNAYHNCPASNFNIKYSIKNIMTTGAFEVV